jgi:hypothetical protein
LAIVAHIGIHFVPMRDAIREDRRQNPRASFGLLFFNKYIDGFPHLGALLEMSATGMLVRKINEPAEGRSFYSIELGIPWTQERLWLWTRRVRSSGDREALRFVGMGPAERARIEALVRDVRRAA